MHHRYKASVNNSTAATNSATAYDLILLAASATVPVLLDRIVLTAGVTVAQIQLVTLQRRSTASTGGTGVTPVAASSGSPAAATVVTYNNVTTVGSASGTPLDAQEWNQIAPYEYNVRPEFDIILPGTWLGLFLPTAPGSTFPYSFTVEFLEVK